MYTLSGLKSKGLEVTVESFQRQPHCTNSNVIHKGNGLACLHKTYACYTDFTPKFATQKRVKTCMRLSCCASRLTLAINDLE